VKKLATELGAASIHHADVVATSSASWEESQSGLLNLSLKVLILRKYFAAAWKGTAGTATAQG